MATSNEIYIHAMEQLFSVSLAKTKSEISEVHRLRYQVYCKERGFLPGKNGIEIDDYDAHSLHVALRRRSGEMVGTARLVRGRRDRPETSFPMQALCQPYLLRDLEMPIEATGEVSRFAISRERRDLNSSTDLLLRLALMRGLLEASIEAGVTHWCAIMELSLFRLLRQVGVDFIQVGAPIAYNGIRHAAVAEIADVLTCSRAGRSGLWNYVTDHGRLAAPPPGYRATPAPAWQPQLMSA